LETAALLTRYPHEQTLNLQWSPWRESCPVRRLLTGNEFMGQDTNGKWDKIKYGVAL